MHCVLVLVAMYAGLAHSFSWEIVTTVSQSNRLDFYDINGTLTHTENITSPSSPGKINNIIYDPVHDRVLYADSHHICSFEITTRKKECFIRNTYEDVTGLAYDPATELLFWIEDYTHLYSISLKPTNKNKVNEIQLISLGKVWIWTITVDSCGGFIYYLYASELFVKGFGRARFNGSEREIVVDNAVSIFLDTDQESHKFFWSDDINLKYNDTTGASNFTFKYADLNGQNVRTVRQLAPNMFTYGLTASKGVIYMRINDLTHRNGTIWKIPKNPSNDIDMEPKLIVEYDKYILGVANKYNIEDIIRVNKNCDTLKSLLSNNSVSTDVSPFCVHGTKVSGESGCACKPGYSGERCEVSVCYNYCLHGDCSASAEGQPKCRCNAGYSGARCEVNACQDYCLNEGVCSLSEESVPVCQCTGGHQGDRCEVPVFLKTCVQKVSTLKDLHTDVTSVKGTKSTGASTPSTVV